MARNPVDVIIGERLNALRVARGMGPDQLGVVLGVTGSDVATYESGDARIPPAQLVAICKFFEVTIRSLFPSLNPNHDPHLH